MRLAHMIGLGLLISIGAACGSSDPQTDSADAPDDINDAADVVDAPAVGEWEPVCDELNTDYNAVVRFYVRSPRDDATRDYVAEKLAKCDSAYVSDLGDSLIQYGDVEVRDELRSAFGPLGASSVGDEQLPSIKLTSELAEFAVYFDGCEPRTSQQIFDVQSTLVVQYPVTCFGSVACEDIWAHPVPTWIWAPKSQCSALGEDAKPYGLAQSDYFDESCRVWTYFSQDGPAYWAVTGTARWIAVEEQPPPAPPYESLSEVERRQRNPDTLPEWSNATPCDDVDREDP